MYSARKSHPPQQVPMLYMGFPEVTRVQEKRDVTVMPVIFLDSVTGHDEIPTQSAGGQLILGGPAALSTRYNPSSCTSTP